MKMHREMLTMAQRKALLRFVCAYRIVSVDALNVITRIVPIDLVGVKAQ